MTFIRRSRNGCRAPAYARIDELPVPAQNEIRARRGELAPEEHPEKRRMSLLQRLAAVGLGRREQEHEEPEAQPNPQPISRCPNGRSAAAGNRAPSRPSAGAAARDAPGAVSEYAKRSSPQGLDQHRRQAPVHNHGEDQLDIPASCAGRRTDPIGGNAWRTVTKRR